jgi:NAD(P)-dependent dehydrogenase (short-subunit alcohol dehydrogenase family)
LNCIVSSCVMTRVISAAAVGISSLEAIFDFLGGLVHGCIRNICPHADARANARQTEWKPLMSIFDLTGRVAVITGGNGGIGLGIARALAAAGCNVSIWGRNAEKNKAAAATMAGSSGKTDTRICDVSDPASVKAAMAATLDAFGRVDGCFANAGIGGGGRRAFIDRTEEEWRKMFATNLDGVFHVFQAAARHMTERAEAGDRFGRLVATSSLASIFGTARNEHYAATKAAINALVRALAVELARHGVTANAILPGWIKSDMTANIMTNEKFVANVMPRIPMRRFGEASDFGGLAVYLMSKASSYHTADCFVIDGGYTAF